MKTYQVFAVCIFLLASSLPAVAFGVGGIQGTVTIDGQPAQGIPVSLDSPDQVTQRTQSDATGRYSFAGLVPGNYAIHVTTTTDSPLLGIRLPADSKVTVMEDTNTAADLTLRRVPTFEKIKVLLGSDAIGFLGEATRVQAFRVGSPDDVWNFDQGPIPQALSHSFPRMDGWFLLGTAKEPSRVLAQKLRQILLDGSYLQIRILCITRPGVIFRLWKGSQSLDVLLCFHCGEMYTVMRDSTGKAKLGIYIVMGGDTKSSFARLAKEAFPDDTTIQAL